MTRDSLLDIVKGMCVIWMVVYHTLNYFPIAVKLTLYFRFVSCSFIFIAGYISIHYGRYKYMNKDIPIKKKIRLFVRGSKLIIICIFANFIINWTIGTSFRGIELQSLEQLLYILSGVNKRFVTFDLLVPIGYVLILIGLINILANGKNFFILSIITSVLVIYSVTIHFELQTGYYIRFVSIGLFGALCGFINSKFIKKTWNYSFKIFTVFLVQLVLLFLIGGNYIFDITYTVLAIIVMYIISIRMNKNGFVANNLILLGQYTLISYQFQVMVLRCLQLIFQNIQYMHLIAFTAFILTSALTVCFVRLVIWSRKRFAFTDNVYRYVFS